MERAVIHSDLKKKEIQPKELLESYLTLLNQDIKKMFIAEFLEEASCPVTGEQAVQESFSKMDMQYKVSKTFGNIYLSPRPSMDLLRQFYIESSARKFWLTKLWPETAEVRKEKIILPQLEWISGFISQYSSEKKLHLAEFLPNHWDYYTTAMDLFPEWEYQLFESLFDSSMAERVVTDGSMTDELTDNSIDVTFLFEALDRSPVPLEVLAKAQNVLKPGGLCFITCLLSSGFEVKLLGQESGIFAPPERMNLLSYEGMNTLIEKAGDFEVLEFSTPSVLDIPNVEKYLEQDIDNSFFQYIFNLRQDYELRSSFQDFLQLNRLGTFGRLVLRKK